MSSQSNMNQTFNLLVKCLLVRLVDTDFRDFYKLKIVCTMNLPDIVKTQRNST